MKFLNAINKPMKMLLLSPWIMIICIYFFLTLIIPIPVETIIKYINDIDTKTLLIGIFIYYLYFLTTNLITKRKIQIKSLIIFNIKIIAYAMFIIIFLGNINLVVRYSDITIIKDSHFWQNICYMGIYISFYIGCAIQKISSNKTSKKNIKND